MKWDYWMTLYLRTHCVARGLRPLSIASYEDALRQFRAWIHRRRPDCPPDAIAPREFLEWSAADSVDTGLS